MREKMNEVRRLQGNEWAKEEVKERRSEQRTENSEQRTENSEQRTENREQEAVPGF